MCSTYVPPYSMLAVTAFYSKAEDRALNVFRLEAHIYGLKYRRCTLIITLKKMC